MKCLENLERITYPRELVYKITELYTFRGKDFYYDDIFKSLISGITKNTIAKDTYYAAKLLDLGITDARLKLMSKKDCEPKSLEEQIVNNLKKVFTRVQETGDDFDCTSNEVLHLTDMTFQDRKIRYVVDTIESHKTLIVEKSTRSRRELMDKAFSLYRKAIDDNHHEATQVITNLYVDMLNMECFTSCNEYIALLTIYCLFFREGFHVFKYVSFFEKYYQNFKAFHDAEQAANYQYDNGFSHIEQLNSVIINTMLDGYRYIESEVQNHEFDRNLKKVDSVESAIMKLDNVFTKEQIKAACPNLSESTVNRALKKLKEDNKIRPNGTGRAASWIKLVEDEVFTKGTRQQLSLFDLSEMNDGL